MSAQFIALVKLDYVPVVNTDDEVVPDNIGALQLGLQALAKQRAEDFARSELLWGQAVALLAQESEDETGSGAEGHVQVQDDFAMSHMGRGGHDYSNYPGYGVYP